MARRWPSNASRQVRITSEAFSNPGGFPSFFWSPVKRAWLWVRTHCSNGQLLLLGLLSVPPPQRWGRASLLKACSWMWTKQEWFLLKAQEGAHTQSLYFGIAERDKIKPKALFHYFPTSVEFCSMFTSFYSLGCRGRIKLPIYLTSHKQTGF